MVKFSYEKTCEWLLQHGKELIVDPWFEYLKRMCLTSLVCYAAEKTNSAIVIAMAICTLAMMFIWFRNRFYAVTELLIPGYSRFSGGAAHLPLRTKIIVSLALYGACYLGLVVPVMTIWTLK